MYWMECILRMISLRGCGSPDTLCAVDCPRVYEFSAINNPNEKVIAIWSPTSCGKAPFTYNLDLGGASSAHVVTIEPLSLMGNVSLVSGTIVPIQVSEQPVFIKVGESSVPPIVSCLNNFSYWIANL